MPRIADALERESRTVDLEQGDFERLLGRRERKQRNRRIRAGALGVIVALAIGLVLVRSLTSDPIPADPPVEPKPAPAASGTLTYSLDGDIYVADPDGSNAVKIANGRPDEDCYSPGGVGESYWAEGSMWSPDGRYIAYRHTECSDPEFPSDPEFLRDVVISDAEGNVVATFHSDGWDIAWSPDSTRIAVWDRLLETIGVYGVDGARQSQLTMPPGWTYQGDHDPVWMPDGTSVWIDGWALPVDGSTPRLLPFGGDPYPTFSPDGSLVAYVAYNDNRSLMVARSDGSEPREVVGRRWVRDPVWSPTGDRIAFIYSEKNVYGPNNELRVLDVATGDVTPLYGMSGSVDIWTSQFSPEGDRILFSIIEDRKGESSLWSVGVDGSDARLVVAGAIQGDWSP